MNQSHALLRQDRRQAARAVPLLWLLASLCLLQWGLSVGPIGGSDRDAAAARQAGNSLGSSQVKLRDLAKLAGTDMRAKDGKPQAAPAGGDAALAAGTGPVLLVYAGRGPILAGTSDVRDGNASYAFRARAPPRLFA